MAYLCELCRCRDKNYLCELYRCRDKNCLCELYRCRDKNCLYELYRCRDKSYLCELYRCRDKNYLCELYRCRDKNYSCELYRCRDKNYLCELYRCRDKNYLPAMAFISCSVSVTAGTQFILENTSTLHSWVMLCILRVAFHSCGVYRPTCKIIAIEVPTCIKPLFSQLVNKLLAFYRSQRFIAAFEIFCNRPIHILSLFLHVK
jgi:hypothetical protein